MKTNKNLKISKRGSVPLRADDDAMKGPKIHKDKSSKKRLSIYDDFSNEDPDDYDLNYQSDEFDEE